MKFCPQCQTRLRHTEDVLACPRCEYRDDEAAASVANASAEEVSELNVLTEAENDQTLPTTKTDCPRCGHTEAVWWMFQTRSADEPTTQFYRCTGCSHTWRDYS